MPLKLLVLDSHPVQYRVPIWQKMEQLQKGSVHVVYASDCSVRGYHDKDFNLNLAWDNPLLEGYENTVLNCERGIPLSNWNSLTGKGLKEIIKKIKPDAVLLTGLNYKYDLVGYKEAKIQGYPLWLRCETQDKSSFRSASKSLLRSIIYYIIYKGINRFFYIGELNKQHYLSNGVAISKLKPAYYCTANQFFEINTKAKSEIRNAIRKKLDIESNCFIIGFSGKFIPKKNPTILFRMLSHLPEYLRSTICLYFIGSGELEKTLTSEADIAYKKWGIKTFFTGFLNQSALAPHYLAIDTLVLPSQRQGETWGLVVNEAMQAGCSVVVSDAVGCSADFYSWERFKIFKEGDESDLSSQITSLFNFTKDFEWASENLLPYSIEAVANTFLQELSNIAVS